MMVLVSDEDGVLSVEGEVDPSNRVYFGSDSSHFFFRNGSSTELIVFRRETSSHTRFEVRQCFMDRSEV
jgi:hypothetical protein